MSEANNNESGPTSRWVRYARKIYHPLGFKHSYSFILFFITCGALVGFVLARLQYLSIDGIFLKHAIPQDAAAWAKPGPKRVGVIVHLATIFPAGLLVVLQFVPVIRYKALLFHRLNGYVVIFLLVLSLAGAFIITPTAAGGGLATQTFLGILGSSTFVSLCLAYVNIKRLRIDLHREWMIRTWVYASSIITLRLIQLAGISAMKTWPGRGFYDVQSCTSIQDQYALYGVPPASNVTQLVHPACVDLSQSVAVSTVGRGPENGSAQAIVTFAMSGWLALTLHAVCVEVYFRFTQDESERLRQVSAERRRARTAADLPTNRVDISDDENGLRK